MHLMKINVLECHFMKINIIYNIQGKKYRNIWAHVPITILKMNNSAYSPIAVILYL